MLFVGPKRTTSSKNDETMKRYRLDRHGASAYLIALSGGPIHQKNISTIK